MMVSRAMTHKDALTCRAEMLLRASLMAAYAANEALPWGYRYHAAVTGDDCLDVAKEFDAYIKEFCREG